MKKRSKQEEMTRRGAAGMAKTTNGRSRIVNPNKKVYDRKTQEERNQEIQDDPIDIMDTIEDNWAEE